MSDKKSQKFENTIYFITLNLVKVPENFLNVVWNKDQDPNDMNFIEKTRQNKKIQRIIFP